MRSITFQQSVGSGAFGTVYRAELSSRQGFRRQVAVKVLHRQAPSDGEQLLSRIRDEARLLGLLQDDIIIKVLEIATVAERDAVIMEYVEGVDLESIIDNGHRPPPRALCELTALVAGGLGRAHTARHPNTGEPLNVIHRDVKPANIMITRSGAVKLLDFGVARARFDARESHTGQLVLGTLNYMAPEYIVTGEVSPAADVYGLGVSVWQVATGDTFGQPRVRQDSHERRLQERLAQLEGGYAALSRPLEAMLRWDHTRRPSAHSCEGGFDRIAGKLEGSSLRIWAREAVAAVLDARGTVKDPMNLVGRTLSLGSVRDAAVEPPAPPVDPSEVAPKPAAPAKAPSPQPSPAPAPQPRPAPAPAPAPPAPPAPGPFGMDRELFKTIVSGLLMGGSLGLLAVGGLVAWVLTR